MSKLAWVLLPLLLAGAVAVALVLARRPPTRIALNVVSSLLLLVYLSITAGLGIFWVAQQHLPVFDWHYLFGYATVALLAVHLAFNFRIAWQWLRRRAAVRHAPPTVPPGPDRPRFGALDRAGPPASGGAGRRGAVGVLGVIGLAAYGGGSFWLGLRHGRTELRIEATGATADAGDAATALAVVERFHDFSSHTRSGVLRRAPSVDWGDPPPPFKPDDGRPALALPDPRGPARSGEATHGLATLSSLLWHTAGVSETRAGIHFRTAPSSGALFATELYVAAPDWPGLDAAIWHHDARGHRLRRWAALPGGAAALGLGSDDAADGARAVLFATAVFRRSGHKYRDRTYRYVLADLGHALENLRVAAAAWGLPLGLLTAFDGARAAAALGIDESEEGVLAVALLGGAAAPPGRGAALSWAPAPIASEDGGTLGVTDAVHRATSLRALPIAPTAHAATAPARAAAPATAALVGPAPTGSSASWLLPTRTTRADADPLAVIARRRSRRRFARTPLSPADLATLLDAMAHPAPVLSPAVRIAVVTSAVEGLDAAAWVLDPARRTLRQTRMHGDAARDRARSAALAQDVIGDAAAVVVLSIDRAALAADPGGTARGYRHAFLEAGMVGERLYLEAEARGLGCCAVGAFYDDEAAALVGADPRLEWVVHFAALGVPA